MLDLGTVRPGSTIRIPFSTFDKDDGSSITMTNFAAADILVYKDGDTTARASTNGFTATTDFSSKTGKHLIVIDLADNSTAGFYSAGSEYIVAVDAVTVDTVSVGGWVARFRIGYRGSLLDTTVATLASQTSFTLTAGPAEDNALNGMWVMIHDVASAVQCGWAVISSYTGSTKTVTLAAATTYTVATTDGVSVMGPVPLQPTVLGRTLDVSSTGEAGVDWANVGGATTTVGLTNTTVGTVTTTTTATNVTNERAKYMHGAVWIGAAANTNTVSYVDGIMTNPVSTIAAAKTIADNLGLKRFWVQSGVTITLGANYAGYYFTGAGYILGTSGSRDVSASIFEKVEGMTGTYTCSTGECIVYDSQLGNLSIGEVDFLRCHLMGTVTMTQANVPYRFHDCSGISSAKIAFAATNQTAVVSNVSGVLTVAGMTSSGQKLYIDGNGELTLDNTNTSGTVYINGNIRLTNQGSGQTIYDTSRYGEEQNVTTVTGNVDGNVGGNVTGSVGSLATQAKSDVNAEVLDVLNTDTFAEPSQGTPGATISLAQKISFLYKAWRNRVTQSSSQYSLYNDDAVTVDHKATFSDNGTTADRGEVGSGP